MTLALGTRVTLVRVSPLRPRAKLAAVAGGDIEPQGGAVVVDAAGQFVTPRMFDAHSHLGVYPTPGAVAHLDGSEREPDTRPVVPQAQSADAFWPQDPGIERAVAGGVTTIQVLSGSGNLIRWCAVTMELRPVRSPSHMPVTVAPGGLKVASGENPKRSYGKDKRVAGMGNLALQRAAFLKAKKLQTDWARWRDDESRRIATEAKRRSPTRRERPTPQASSCEDPAVPTPRSRTTARRVDRGEPSPQSSPPPTGRSMARHARATPA
ncbi:hypothetical protein WME91_22785 [Sorangium sp. So ce269]